jgi:hypothetical protein
LPPEVIPLRTAVVVLEVERVNLRTLLPVLARITSIDSWQRQEAAMQWISSDTAVALVLCLVLRRPRCNIGFSVTPLRCEDGLEAQYWREVPRVHFCTVVANEHFAIEGPPERLPWRETLSNSLFKPLLFGDIFGLLVLLSISLALGKCSHLVAMFWHAKVLVPYW